MLEPGKGDGRILDDFRTGQRAARATPRFAVPGVGETPLAVWKESGDVWGGE
jgi:hypothetical protein